MKRVLVGMGLCLLAVSGCDCDRYDPDEPFAPNLGDLPCCHEVEQPVQEGQQYCQLCD